MTELMLAHNSTFIWQLYLVAQNTLNGTTQRLSNLCFLRAHSRMQ